MQPKIFSNRTFAAVTRGTFRFRPLLIAAYFAAAGCFSYQPATLNAPNGELPAGVRIIRSDSSVVVLAVAQVIGDTIRGFRENSTVPVMIPVNDVRAVESARLMPIETIGAVTAGAWITYWITNKIKGKRMRRI